MPGYTDLLGLFKPVVGGDYNAWGTYLNNTIDLTDEALVSPNFAQNAASHSGLNFYYKAGRVINENTPVDVAAGYVTLTNGATNYVEVSTSGTVSANTTSFTKGQIPLYQVTTASGSITNVTEKRSFMQVNLIDIASITSSVIDTDSDGNVLLNGASAETSSEKALTMKQGVDPTTSTADQISIFATSGADSTFGLRTEASLSGNVLKTSINGSEKYLHFRHSSANPLSSFIYTNVNVTNTTTETEILSFTLPGNSSPTGQKVDLRLFGKLTTGSSSYTCTVRIYVNDDTQTITSLTTSTWTNENFKFLWDFFVKTNTNYNMCCDHYLGGQEGLLVSDFTDDFTTDTILKVTAQWSVADAGNILEVTGGCYEVKN